MVHTRRLVALPLVLAATLAAVACSQAPGVQQRGDAAWSARLTQQAESVRREAEREQRARDAWTQRLTEQVRAFEERRTQADRANRAWTERLNALADLWAGRR